MSGNKSKSLVPKGPTAYRFVCYASQSGNVIGVYELEFYDANGVNLCRNPGTVPEVSFSPNAGKSSLVDVINYPGSNAIDGDWTNWPRTAYAACATDGSAYLLFDFPVAVNVAWWRVIFEGNFIPTANGFELQQLVDGIWKKVTGIQSPSYGYYRDQWYRFTDLKVG